MSALDIRQLRYFIAIVEEKTISAAAKRLHMSQPPLSQQLKAMEEALGTTLIERNGKSLAVTEAGKTLYQHALEIVQLMEEAQTAVTAVGQGMNGNLSLGVNTFSENLLPAILEDFQAAFPEVTYTIQQNESVHLCQLVRERVLELAIIRLPLPLEDFHVLHLRTEPFYFVTAQKLPIEKTEIELRDLQQSRLIFPSTEGLGVHYLLLEAFSRYPFTPNIVGECSDIELLMTLVANHFAATIVPETLIPRFTKRAVHTYRIANTSELTGSVGLIWLKNHHLSKAAQNFISFLQARL